MNTCFGEQLHLMKSVTRTTNKRMLLIMLVAIAIASSFTGSAIRFFSIGGIAVTPMRMSGLLCFVYAVLLLAKNPVVGRLHALFVIWTVYMIFVSIVMSVDRASGISLLFDYLVCIGMVRMIIYTSNSMKTFKQYLKIVYVCLVASILICIYEFLTGHHIASNYTAGWSGESLDYLLKAPTGLLYNPNNVGVLMVICIPLIFLIPHFFEGTISKIAAIILMVLDMAVILMTGSRGALVAGAIVILSFILISNLRIGIKIGILFLGVIVLIKSTDFIFRQLAYGGMMKNGVISIFAEGDSGRLSLAKRAIQEAFSQNVFFGVGPGGVDMLVGMPPHNFWVEILSNFGIIGMILFGSVLLGVVMTVKRVSNKTVRRCFMLLILALLLSMFIPPTMMTLHFNWMIVALIISYAKIEKVEGRHHECTSANK